MCKWEISKGFYTILILDRKGWSTRHNTARLAEKSGPGGPGEDLCGELIACVNHIGTGSTGGHYVSYTKLDQVF